MKITPRKSKRRKPVVLFIISVLFLFSCALASELLLGKGIPFVYKTNKWSIGIYTGDGPFNFVSPDNIINPVLTAKDVTDIEAEFVADPFMVKEGSMWYMFFEVMNRRTNQGDIGLAISEDGLHWKYEEIVLDESFHLSYPHVFKWNNNYYMIPESYEVNSIRLYKAVDFPTQWSSVKVLIDGKDYVDSSIFEFNDKWWLFSSTTENDILYLYYAENLTGPWNEHPKNPIIKDDANIARAGGRVLIFDKRIIRYAQDDEPEYGKEVRAFEITELTTTGYREEEACINPILKASGTGWNREGMHHIDPHQLAKNRWIACVDGNFGIFVFKILN